MSAYISICQHISAYVSIYQHMSLFYYQVPSPVLGVTLGGLSGTAEAITMLPSHCLFDTLMQQRAEGFSPAQGGSWHEASHVKSGQSKLKTPFDISP